MYSSVAFKFNLRRCNTAHSPAFSFVETAVESLEEAVEGQGPGGGGNGGGGDDVGQEGTDQEVGPGGCCSPRHRVPREPLSTSHPPPIHLPSYQPPIHLAPPPIHLPSSSHPPPSTTLDSRE
jgi:hypothetical protein